MNNGCWQLNARNSSGPKWFEQLSSFICITTSKDIHGILKDVATGEKGQPIVFIKFQFQGTNSKVST